MKLEHLHTGRTANARNVNDKAEFALVVLATCSSGLIELPESGSKEVVYGEF